MTMTNRIPLDIGPIHFVGIGGIGMSGIAHVMHKKGYVVRGSDNKDSAVIRQLRDSGVEVFIGHRGHQVEDVAIVVYSSAVPLDNVELKAAREAEIPVVHRSEMLSEIIRLSWSVLISGTHGKTTITSMLGETLTRGNYDPTVISGGVIRVFGSNARAGDGKWVVAEADESDGSMLGLPGIIAVVTSIDIEHLSYWNSFDAVVSAYHTMINQLPFYGLAVLCVDHPQVRELAAKTTRRRVLSYGISQDADVHGCNVRIHPRGMLFDVVARHPLRGQSDIKDLCLPMFGQHNVSNALAVVAVALELGMSAQDVQKALEEFGGVDRRFTELGWRKGVQIIDDYAHHPVEIKASIEGANAAIAARGAGLDANDSDHPLSVSAGVRSDLHHTSNERLIVVVEPHRYSRIQELFQDFARSFSGANKVFVAPICAVGETPVDHINQHTIASAINKFSQVPADIIDMPDGLAYVLDHVARPGDTVLIQGAGGISQALRRLMPLTYD